MLDAVRPAVSSIFVMVKEPGPYEFLECDGVRVERDLTEAHHPLGGIYSGLFRMETDMAFVAAADMPAIRTDLIPALAEAARGHDAAVPVHGDRLQPLCAVYDRACLPAIGRMIDRGEFRILDLFGRVRTRFFTGDEGRAVDPSGRSFTDVDTPEAPHDLSRRQPEEHPYHAD